MKQIKDITTLGFALFAMFFGAGNLLLPPFIGLHAADQWDWAIIGFCLTGILLPLLGVLSIINSGESFQDLGNRTHPYIATILGIIIMLGIGPLIAIPRTAATTFEVGLLPAFPNLSPIWGSILFFTVTFILSIRPSKVVNVIGNFLTPLLLILLIGMIIMGALFPLSADITHQMESIQAFKLGFIEGYQTLDVLASVIFSSIIIAAAKAKGYEKLKDKNRIVTSAGCLATFCLLLIYGGLVFLGAKSGYPVSTDVKRAELLLFISHKIFGSYGVLAISISIALACLTTAIALTCAVGTFFSQLFNNRITYEWIVIICCLFSAVLAITGVEYIIQIAYPFLAFIYPIVITLVLYVLIFGRFIKSRLPYIGALAGTTLFSTIYLLAGFDIHIRGAEKMLRSVPFAGYELWWVVPSIIGFALFLLWDKLKTKQY
ncbi:branched-chain amino acid transport system carrier protein [Sphingobacterium faecium NBRC 15299]|uniref:branched-chain amino acid transport system II carrier protein n=1 Tax=Sphingobacterium faecium TaxID=34087 RepID=UPI000D3D12E9|nr:branched-chain amino acid transport system II carrier protein [Sphingobacterium faecium]PTX09547.1 LIVCS family branched-chain amino acid:cation transporter [Sphingobacterium faecium]GEM63833.1 branched-chain amino acid transport system carrier protein [Sphingobacterium faecium NBRC 15299]